MSYLNLEAILSNFLKLLKRVLVLVSPLDKDCTESFIEEAREEAAFADLEYASWASFTSFVRIFSYLAANAKFSAISAVSYPNDL